MMYGSSNNRNLVSGNIKGRSDDMKDEDVSFCSCVQIQTLQVEIYTLSTWLLPYTLNEMLTFQMYPPLKKMMNTNVLLTLPDQLKVWIK